MNKKIIFFLLFFVHTHLVALQTSPEYYHQQMQILRNLDIEPNYLSDMVFLEFKESSMEIHSKTLVDTMREFYKITPIIRKILEKENIPQEFLYLAIVESGLKTHSVSKTKAVGVWQFMKSTAQTLGLRVDPYVDERKDLVKSTYAAIAYLRQLREQFDKWYLAILAYNCGDGKLRQAIKAAKSDDLRVLLDPDKKYLPLETRVFIRKILTMAFLANNSDFLISQDSALLNYTLSNEVEKISIPSSVSLKELAKIAKMSYKDFKNYNPHFHYDFTPPGDKEYYVYIPLNKSFEFKQNLKNTQLAKVDTTIPHTKIYVVKQGDSLYTIAKKHNISVETIKEYNKIKGNLININQKLVLKIKEKNNDKIKTAQNT
ncbi:peptidoglycan-binding LysM:Lytic transglycosylase, catalytic (SLT family) [Campylobacter insulaenigrae]|uniref:lytic transglycosylase domain-containing protein n=1 Tax=Campylobacter insulaenigrae TaxID=260714 RepID=UPI000F6EEFE5|nr:lytic transglycosylase domain-containing protein [Campylobacter insulaenigrae]MCR6590585.1 transglycosylase SLT domain-containing protein [Campylobacter insulaenigrae]MCR6592122.1 transglycosylase SLT domain-containing protein [Campylobacter insulaenigrae]VEJ53495.1 peptidoglycan-binding LysM:Lytic transglycosylase, catalytic (SLT family) [Campylobacter insulaenigrae]